MEWIHPPGCERHSGFGTKLNTCVCCEGYITPGDVSHFCLFREIGYELDGTFYALGESISPGVHKGGETFQDKAGESHIGAPIPPSNGLFSFHLRSMHRESRLGTGAYLDVQRYTTFDARTYAPHQNGARLGFVDLSGYSKIPRSAQQFRAEIRHRTLPQSPDNPASPVGCNSFALGRFRVHSPDVPKDGRRDQIQHGQKPPVRSLCLPPLGENAPIPRSHVPG
jgi:hypothetical protein